MDVVIFSVSFAFVATIAFLLAKPFDKRILVAFALSCAIYLGVDDFVTGLPSMVKGLDVLGDHWNWTGKLLSLALSALIIVALRLSPYVFAQSSQCWRLAFLSILILIRWVGDPPSGETNSRAHRRYAPRHGHPNVQEYARVSIRLQIAYPAPA